MRHKALSLLALAAVGMSLTSCVDDKYDLDDVDATLQLCSGEETFYLPAIKVKDKLRADSILVPDEKTFFVEKDKQGNEMFVLESNGTDNMGLQLSTLAGASSQALEIVGLEFDPMAVKGDNEFLQSDPMDGDNYKIQLDLEDPMLFVTFHNNTNAIITAHLTFYAYNTEAEGALLEKVAKFTATDAEKDLAAQLAIVKDIELSANPGVEARYFLCDHDVKDKDWFPTDETHQSAVYKPAVGLASIIKNVPEQVALMVTDAEFKEPAGGGSSFSFNPNVDSDKFSISLDYDVYAPLRVGKDFQVLYTDTLDGWHESLDIDILDLNTLVVELELDNELPMQFSIDLLPIKASETEGGAPERLDSTVVEFRCVGGDTFFNAHKQGQKKVYELVNKKFTTDRPNQEYLTLMQQLDGVIMKAVIKAADTGTSDTMLRPSDYIKIKNMRLGLKGGVYVDAN